MECYLIRHTAPEVAAGTCYGRLDLPLAANFSQHAATLTKFVHNIQPDTVYSSPAQRCLKLAEQFQPQPLIEPNWQEFNFGDWEGRLWRDIDRDDIARWDRDLVTHQVPNGDSLALFHQRVDRAWRALIEREQHQSKKIVIVTHAGVIRSMVAAVLGIALEKSVLIGLDYGSITKVSYQGAFRKVDYMNRV